MVLSEEQLVKTLREKCDHATSRIWIASPFIGSLNDIRKVIGGQWMRSNIDCRILTDIDAGFIKKDTFNELQKYNAEIKSLTSLHAKIYIVDEWCLVTSANLTGTAFSRRHEIGVCISNNSELIATFERWWRKAKPVSTLRIMKKMELDEYQNGTGFPTLFRLPQYNSKQDLYNLKCDCYKEFASLYEQITGRNQRMVRDGFSLLQEVDYLFNFLYHDHPSISSKNYTKPRDISGDKLKKEIRENFDLMSKEYEKSHQSNEGSQQSRRVLNSIVIRELLAPSKIDRLTWEEVRSVLECFHCLQRRSHYREMFINSNHLRTVRSTWKSLLHTGPVTTQKIKEATKALRAFGNSSAQELVGWYYPEEYPLINSNSDCGMRFFGYNV